MADTKSKDYLTVTEAAEAHGVSESLIQKLTAAREITSYRLGRRMMYRADQLAEEIMVRATRNRVEGSTYREHRKQRRPARKRSA
jgi:excisionase family DNA binding protein